MNEKKITGINEDEREIHHKIEIKMKTLIHLQQSGPNICDNQQKFKRNDNCG